MFCKYLVYFITNPRSAKCWIVLFLFLIWSASSLIAQGKKIKYVQGTELTLSGRSDLVSSEKYHRIDSTDRTALPKSVQYLATNSAGLNLNFQTNSTTIRVKWKLGKYKILPNMTPLAVNGLDLYGWNGKAWQYVSSAMPSSSNNSATFIKNLDGKLRHYKVYLPLYTELINLEIGVERKAAIKPPKKSYVPSEKVIIYGSSITQGASASRPGMAYPSIISRALNVETLNLGFSGSGKMEIEVADILGKMTADLFILDCVPNPSPTQIEDRAVPFIKKLRSLKPNTPILMVESIFREGGYWDTNIKRRVDRQNEAFHQAYKQLTKEGFKQLYYIPSKELTGNNHEETVDGTHLSDAGQLRIADRIGESIKQILGSSNSN